MTVRAWPWPLGAWLVQAALDRVPFHHLTYQVVRRGWRLTNRDEADDEDDDDDGEDAFDAFDAFDTFEFDEAEARLRRGEIDEALIWLERALPRGFSGLADAVIPFLPSRSVRP